MTTPALGGGPRTWEATWATDDLQFAYDRGVFEGAYVFIGLMGMAEAIRRKWHLEACPGCGKASTSRVMPMAEHIGGFPSRGWLCMPCSQKRSTLRISEEGTK